VLAAADPHDDPAPLRARISGQEGRIAEVQARLRRQVLNLEAEDLPPQTRQRVVGRIAELEEELARAQASLKRLRGQAATAPPDTATVRELLATFPIRGADLRDLRKDDLRDLFTSLDLLVHYDHKHHKAQIGVGDPHDHRDPVATQVSAG